MKKIHSILLIISLLFLASIAIVFIYGTYQTNDAQPSLIDDDAICVEGETKTFRNTYVEFEYPCDWMFRTEDITNSNFFDLRMINGAYGGFFWMEVGSLDDFSKIQNFEICESGDRFSEKKMTVKNSDGTLLKACHHQEHGGETLLIQLNNKEYLNISSEFGTIDIIAPSLVIN